MAQKYCVVFLFVSLWNIILAAENRYFCFTIAPTFNIKVVRAELVWGKWIKDTIHFNEIGGPQPGEVIGANDSKRFCSSGRASSSSGTEGYVEFKDEQNRPITVRWDHPWGWGKKYAEIIYDGKIFINHVHIFKDPWERAYFLKYIWPSAPFLKRNEKNYTIPWSCWYYESCLRNSCGINNCLALRKRRNLSDDDDDDSYCDSSDEILDSDCIDHLMVSNIYNGVTNADFGTVDNDVLRFEQDYPPVHLPFDPHHPTPIRQYSTVYFPALDLNLPIVVRARVNSETVAAAGKRNPGGIRDAAKELTEALKRVKTHDGLSYHVGHVVAWVLGGPDAAYNFVPQTQFLNLGQYKKMESNIKKFVKDHPDGWVDMTVIVYYWQNTYMPIAFGINLVYYFTHGVLASNCRDTLFWNQRPYPPNPPSIG